MEEQRETELNSGVNTKPLLSKTTLLTYGTMYGDKTSKWNPKMKPFIRGVNSNHYVIDINSTMVSLNNAYNIVKSVTAKGGNILFVGTDHFSSKTIKENAERSESFFVSERWLGGLLTNFKTIKTSIDKLRELQRLELVNFDGYSKKEGLKMKRSLTKLENELGGIKFMRRFPKLIFVASAGRQKIAIAEARKLHIIVIGIVDTNDDPNSVDIPIFANDDSAKSISLITTYIADAIQEVKGKPVLAAYKNDVDVQVLPTEATISMEAVKEEK